ncbi:hypothetical protein L1987_49991 [Smallanthus sonchifolius]|uniref:Uncharacterized protein n=1 Tax=Smallanthus sonchifolius TaxID=185202 RepID=A0ACB9FX85_9ASTR|nr:hypothetical protein L1987_49991 [Smallanthus sonchifolius]
MPTNDSTYWQELAVMRVDIVLVVNLHKLSMKLYLMFIVLLLSSFHSYEAEGTRLARVLTFSASSNQEIIKISLIKRSNQDHDQLVAKTDELPLVTTLKNRRLFSRVVTKKSHHDHWLPKIHEDYYGPRHHRPRHH